MLKGIYKYVAITKAVTVSICWPRRLKRKKEKENEKDSIPKVKIAANLMGP